MTVSAISPAAGSGAVARSQQTGDGASLPTAEAAALVGQQAAELVLAIRDLDLAAVRQRIHPVHGVRFSPYSYVNAADIMFDRESFPVEFPETIREWGVQDGKGTPIEMPMAEYWDEYVYDRDFVDAPLVSYNHPIGTGNTVNNVAAFFPGSIRVEYHFPNGPDTLDWKSLRLVFQKHAGEWFLVAAIHDQWTI
jgi:hypothetical protein